MSAELDPQHSHYLNANTLDDSRTVKADGNAVRRWTRDIAAFGQILFTLTATL